MRKRHPAYVGLAILFVVAFVVFHWVYGYVVAFQGETNDCFFLFGRRFLAEFLDHPAGALCYAGRFLGQFYRYPWLGALIVSACITCFGILFHRILEKLKGTVSVYETLLPCLLLLALHTSTVYLLHDTLGLCASCAAFLGYLSFRKQAAKRAYALAATPVVYLLLGFYAWLFVAWIVAFEWLDGKPRSGIPFKVAYLVFVAAIPLVAWRWVFPIPLRSALVWPVTFVAPLRAGVLYYSVTQLVVDCLLGAALAASVMLIPFWGRLYFGARLAAFRQAKALAWNRVVPPVVLVVLAVLLHLVRYDASLSTMTACRRLYRQKQWDALLAKVKGRTSLDLDSQLMTNFALYKKGKLLDEMFHYPQVWGSRGLVANFAGRKGLSPAEDDGYRAMHNSDLFYELGHVNLAFQHAYNNMTAMGKTNESLKRMAKCSMANGNYAMAYKYLNLLESTLFDRGFARRYKAIIADPDAAEREFGERRKRYPVVDVPIWERPVMHLAALPMDKDNPMPFDCLTAWLLLEKTKSSLGTVCQNVETFKTAGYGSIPTHCQEMMLLWEREEGTAIDLRGYRYDEAIRARVDQFLDDLSRNRDRPDGVQRLRARYGDTYMFYCFCVPTPEEVGRFLPARTGSGGPTREE